MNKIPISVPVYIEQFVEGSPADRYSKAKLKVFYIGETADHRLFTKNFSDKVKDTLPLTPVVAFYSEEDEDFKGHNKTQYVYGVVPDGAEIKYEEDEENNHTYLITDVVLYTERKDNIGEVAKKIVGKQHSLELNPDTLKYKINRDPQGRFLNVEFLDGQFIGLSVLGDNETPAFTGSGFFALSPDANITETCKEKFNKFIDILNHDGGSIEVFDYENYFSQLQAKFAAVTMQEFLNKIYEALANIGIYGYVLENTDEYAVVHYWSEADNYGIDMKFAIKMDGDKITLEELERVYPRYLTQTEIDALDNSNAASKTDGESSDDDGSSHDGSDDEGSYTDSSEDGDPKGNCADGSSNDGSDDNGSDDGDGDGSDDDSNDGQGEDGNASLSNQESQENGQVATATAGASATTLTDSERAELESYRRQEKISMINEYRGELSDEIVDRFTAECDKFTKEELEAKLAIEYRKYFKNHKNDDSKNRQIMTFQAITLAGDDASYDMHDSAQVINKYVKKK